MTISSLTDLVRAQYFEPHWYAAYTRSRHEKAISVQLTQMSVEQFLPLYESVHQWKDRKVRVQLPLFPGYIFVYLPLRDELSVLQIPGVVRLVSFNGRPLVLPEGELMALRKGLSSGVSVKPHRYMNLAVGRFVKVKSGPLSGLTGRLIRRKGDCRIVISIESIMRSISTEISLDDIEIASVRERGVPGSQPSLQGSAPSLASESHL
jgi:transcription antitermination factor NusG